MHPQFLSIATVTLRLLVSAVSAQSTCGAFNLSTADNTGDEFLYVAANGTIILGRPLAPNSTNIAFAFTIDSNGGITTRANDTTLQCGFPENGAFFECDTPSSVESREGTDEELVSEFDINGDGRLSWRDNDTFFACSARQLGYARNELPAWDVILVGDRWEPSNQDVDADCRALEIVSSTCRQFTSADEAGQEDDGGDDGGDSNSPAVDGTTGGSGESGGNELQSLWTVNAVIAALWLLL